jgi:hypothetical protein
VFESLPGVGKLGRLLFLFYRGKQGLSLANQFGRCLPSQRVADLSWAFVSLNSLPLLRIANKENSATPSAEDRCMVERRRPYDPGSARRALPILSPCRAVGVNSEGLLKSESDEYILAKQSLINFNSYVLADFWHQPTRILMPSFAGLWG